VARVRGEPAPPDITLVYPFVGVADLTAEVLRALRVRFGAFPAFDLRLARTTRFLDVMFLDPEPAEPFRTLIRVLGADGPGGVRPPYPIEVTDILPHVTVVRSEDPAVLERAEAALAPELPIACRVREARILAEGTGGSWQIHASFPLDGA
jgi:2'-5' RNA ligase superfamily